MVLQYASRAGRSGIRGDGRKKLLNHMSAAFRRSATKKSNFWLLPSARDRTGPQWPVHTTEGSSRAEVNCRHLLFGSRFRLKTWYSDWHFFLSVPFDWTECTSTTQVENIECNHSIVENIEWLRSEEKVRQIILGQAIALLTGDFRKNALGRSNGT